MAGKQFETLQGFRAKPSLVVNCCVTQTHAALLLRERKNVVLFLKKINKYDIENLKSFSLT